MGVQARIVLCGADADEAKRAALAVFARWDELDLALSDWRVDGELARLEQRAGSGAVEVSDDLFRCLELARLFAAASQGAFDPTVAPVVALWRDARARGRLPDETELAQAHELVDWSRLELDVDRRTVRLPVVGMNLDLGGIAKGFATDEALALLAELGFDSALVELGGDLAIGAAPPGEDGWRVRIDGGDLKTLVRVGVATSGDREQYVEIDGRRYSHVIDARTGQALVDSPNVTVIAADAATADALASAVSVLGVEAGAELVGRFPKAELHAGEAQNGANAGITEARL